MSEAKAHYDRLEQLALDTGAAAERKRIRRELLEAIDKHSFTVSGGIKQRLAVIGFGRVSPLIERVELLAALDRICPEEK